MKFSKRMDALGDEIFAALNEKKIELEAQGKQIVNLSVGTPDFAPEEYLKEALIDAASVNENWKYTLRDDPEMLQAVVSYYKRRYDVEITPDMVTSCYGTQDGLGHLPFVLIDEGDTVLLPTPCYPVFIAGAKAAGADIYYYPMLKENNFLPDVSLIPDEVSEKARYMVVSLPSNPMGSVGTDRVYEEIIAYGKAHDILIVHDNAYSDIIYDGNHGGSFLKYDGAVDNGVEFFSLSKSFNLTGARISFMVGRPDVVSAYRKFRSQIDFGMFMPIQKVAIAALTGPMEPVQNQCLKYQERRDALCSGLRNIGWNVPDSKGSMFVWAPIPEKYTSSMDFCLDLIEKSGVICTPGSSFGPLGEGFVRFALVLPPEQIRDAVRRISESGILR